MSIKAKPYLKWAGGKTQLLPAIESFLPSYFDMGEAITYIEPFVGGGAVFFHLLQKYPNIKNAVINDVNLRLVKTYKVVRDTPFDLICALEELQSTYLSMPQEDDRKAYYLEIRDRFNRENCSDTQCAAYLIFLNRTCFNGLYRENSKGLFNVPFGKYKNPKICDSDVILADSRLLQNVVILHGDFSQVEPYIDRNTFIYFDPPYRPLSTTSNFNSYVGASFDDNEQIRLKSFVDRVSERNCNVLISNSDGRCVNSDDMFMDELYKDYIIERVYAKRSINANPEKRGKLTELLIRNYKTKLT